MNSLELALKHLLQIANEGNSEENALVLRLMVKIIFLSFLLISEFLLILNLTKLLLQQGMQMLMNKTALASETVGSRDVI